MPSKQTTLTLPNDADVLPVARSYVQSLTTMAGLRPDQAGAIERAAMEACANVVDHAYEPGDEKTFSVVGEVSSVELSISVRDQGLPFHPMLTPEGALPKGRPARVSASGGLALIRQSVDKADWINHGRAGKELKLVKFRDDCAITEQLSQEQLARFDEQAPRAPEQEYTIRLMRPEDAAGVSQVIYRAYGYTYTNDDCYYPERIARLNEEGRFVSVIAVDAGGEVVGHYALKRPNLERIAERGALAVAPAHRGRDLADKMRVFLEDEARRLGLVGVYSWAVTQHVYSQRVNEQFESDVCGVILGWGPRTLNFKSIQQEPQPQRVSAIHYYTYIDKPQPQTVYAPPHLRDLLGSIYARLEAPVTFGEGAPPEGDGQLEMIYTPSVDFGDIRVRHVGADTPHEIRAALEELIHEAGAEVVYLSLPLSQPGTIEVCRAAEAMGFFFTGLGPEAAVEGGDVLNLTYLNVPMDLSLLKIASPFAQELVQFVDADRKRVAAARA